MAVDAPDVDSAAVQLAVPLSIAVRIEPELIRAIRLAILPYLDVSAESALWFADDLVAARDPDAIVLRPELLPVLRARLASQVADSATADPIRSVWDITSRVHASISPALALEEKVAWLAATAGEQGRTAIEDELRTALHALRDQGRTGIADWLVGAWPRLPSSVRGTKLAWQLRQAASVHADTSRMPLGVLPAGYGVADLADFAADVPDVPVAVRLTGGQLEIGDIGAPPGAVAIPLMDTDPRIVELLPHRDAPGGTTIAIPRGETVSVAVGGGPASLLTPRGLVYQVAPYAPRLELMPLRGSERQSLAGAQPAGQLDLSAAVTIIVVLRRRNELPPYDEFKFLTSAELGAQYGADPADAELVAQVLSRWGLTVANVDIESRLVTVGGTLQELSTAFGTSLRAVASPHPDGSGPVFHRYRDGLLMIPAELDGVVTAVLGLDDRPQAQLCALLAGSPGYPQAETPSRGAEPLTAPQVADCYVFPQGTDGTGETLAILEFGNPLILSADQYFSGLGIAIPRTQVIGGDQGDQSLPLSLAVSGALAPGASHLVYFGPDTDRGFVETLAAAIYATPTPTAVSIGWGASEDAWTPQARASVNQLLADAAALGITVCVAAGDGGSESGQGDAQSHVYFPASSPYALACGGTSLSADVSSGLVISEVVWRATGGGVSDTFAQPSWQAFADVPRHAEGGSTGRGVPDVAGNADPATGYLIVVDGRPSPVGGTAMVAAMWAALVCRFAQATGRRLGHLQPVLYRGTSPGVTPPGFRSITSGNNGAYQAGPGWDACTGLGSPNGAELLRLLGGTGGLA